jgi:tetratricopeptide (TPR) repeat protein
MSMLRSKVLIALVCLLVFTAQQGRALQDRPQKAEAAPEYSKESFIVIDSETHLRFQADGASTRTQTESIKVLSEAGVHAWGVLEFGYASENEHVEIHYVRVHKADGATVTTPAANALDLPSDVTRAAPMYSDLKQKQIPVKALGVGDTLDFEVTYVEDKPLVPGQFWFSYNFARSFVDLKEVLEIRFPRDKQPKVANADLKPVITEDGAERVYTWTTSNTAPTKPDGTDNAEEEPKKPSVQISTFASWQQVGEWYGKLAQPQAKVTPEIQAKADALVKNLPAGADQNPAQKSDQTEARIQAIYDFVSIHIHYISLSFGVGRYQPHPAADVLENEYGDCKDKHTLLAALLKAEGIEAWPVLIHSSEKLDEDVPSPSQFDHLITVIPQGKQYLWLDSTPEIAPYAMLMSSLRDKQALVVAASGAPFLMKTPAAPPFPAEDHLVMRGNLDDGGTFSGHADLTMRGDSEVLYRSIFHASAKAKWQDLMQAISYRLGFGGEVSNVQVDDPDITRQPFHLAWDYQRKKYGDWDNRQILPPAGGIPINFISEDKKPKSAIALGFPATTTYTAELTLPPGASMEPPPDVDVKTPFAEYHAKYSVNNGKYLTERRLTVLQKEVPVADWQKYVAFQKELTTDYNRMSSVTTAGAVPPSGAKDVGEAADLIQSAMQSCQAQELNQCEDQLDKAKKLNPRQTNLSASYGSLYMAQGKMDMGLEAFRQELKDHPDNLRVARWFAQMLVRLHRESDAIDMYRAVLKTAPDDIDANSEIARMLVAKEDWKSAQPILEKTIQLRPDNAQIRIWYGQSCLQNGKEAEGLDALKTAAISTNDPAALASIASSLTSSGKALDLAQTIAKSAVVLIEEQTGSIALNDITNAQIKKMVDLAQIWNSMSLAAFKAGNLEVAEKYAQAAWLLAQEPNAGDRLAQIYEKQGKSTLALESYRLAKARAYPTVPGIDDRIQSLEKRIGHASSRDDLAASHLQDLRIVHLPRLKSLSASADFLVLFNGGKVSDVKMLGGDPRIEPYAEQLKHAKFNIAFPDDGPEHVIRQGILSCSVYDPNCMFLMALPPDANTNSRSSIPIQSSQTTTIQLKAN